MPDFRRPTVASGARLRKEALKCARKFPVDSRNQQGWQQAAKETAYRLTQTRDASLAKSAAYHVRRAMVHSTGKWGDPSGTWGSFMAMVSGLLDVDLGDFLRVREDEEKILSVARKNRPR